MRRTLVMGVVWVGLLSAVPAVAQPPAPPKIWTATASAGLALTNGNSDTSTINAAYDLLYDPHTRNLVKSEGLLIRGETEGELSSQRLALSARDEYTLAPRLIVFGALPYLRDQFKAIDYLVAPTGGLGYKVLDTEKTKFTVDGGAGVVWEKNPGVDVNTSASLSTGDKLNHNLTATASLTQSFTALWKTEDFDDALYAFNVGLAAAISARTQLKVEFLDIYKNKPPNATVDKNDIALLMSIVFKM